MLNLQYAHRLPADYPMARIRERVAARGPLWDATAGLVFKAFALRERAAGAAGNVYSSIYLWQDAAAAVDMLTDETRFGAVIGTFGRPRVETLLPLVARTKGDGADVRTLLCEDVALDAKADPHALRAEETTRVARALAETDVLAAVSALDTRDWRLVRYTLSCATAPAGSGAYEVAHLAHPGWAHLSDRS